MQITTRLYFLFIVLWSASYAQEATTFNVEIINALGRKKSIKIEEKQSSYFYEDEKYKVENYCSGEWGGKVVFIDKGNSQRFECKATCPVIINKVDEKYIITNTLAHLHGFSQVLEISDSSKMQKASQYEVNALYERTSIKGTTTLWDSVGVLTIGSFPYHGTLYHIIAADNETFIATIDQGKLNKIQTIINKRIWTYNPLLVKTKEGGYLYLFKNSKVKGHLEVKGNSIKVYI